MQHIANKFYHHKVLLKAINILLATFFHDVLQLVSCVATQLLWLEYYVQ